MFDVSLTELFIPLSKWEISCLTKWCQMINPFTFIYWYTVSFAKSIYMRNKKGSFHVRQIDNTYSVSLFTNLDISWAAALYVWNCYYMAYFTFTIIAHSRKTTNCNKIKMDNNTIVRKISIFVADVNMCVYRKIRWI